MGQSEQYRLFDLAPGDAEPLGPRQDTKELRQQVGTFVVAENERELAGVAVALGASAVAGWSAAEQRLADEAVAPAEAVVASVRERIVAGDDPLGEVFCQLRTAATRRVLGATYTPAAIQDVMVEWAAGQPRPGLVVDPGAGTARFMVAAGRALETSRLLGIEVDPLAAMLARAHLAVSGNAARSEILCGNFLADDSPAHQPSTAAIREGDAGARQPEQLTTAATGDGPVGAPVESWFDRSLRGRSGPVLFLGNPPYVRHHQIEGRWKELLAERAARLGLRASGLAGLHIHFLVRIAALARPGDYGCVITSAEWLDVNYGQVLRELFLERLGGVSLTVIDPEVKPFADAETTGAILCFRVGERPASVMMRRVRSVAALGPLVAGQAVRRERLAAEARWTQFSRQRVVAPAGYVELGELCRVHRGQVTGANRVWIAGPHSAGLPASVLRDTVTRARELYEAGETLAEGARLKQVIDLPVDLDELPGRERELVEKFLMVARRLGAAESYVARHRRAWWAVELKTPAPILATYMARRPPAFVVNAIGARHLNIAHGLYPREAMSNETLGQLARYLSRHVSTAQGRTYAGGLTKFEPREMERILVPEPAMLAEALHQAKGLQAGKPPTSSCRAHPSPTATESNGSEPLGGTSKLVHYQPVGALLPHPPVADGECSSALPCCSSDAPQDKGCD